MTAMLFVLRQKHVEALATAASEAFEDRIVAYLCTLGPEAAAHSEERMRVRVRDGIGEAAKYGITSERDVGLYLHLLMTLAPAEHGGRLPDWARTRLERPDMDVRRRLNLIRVEAMRRQRAEQSDALFSAPARRCAAPGHSAKTR
jgi:hypothetical protein